MGKLNSHNTWRVWKKKYSKVIGFLKISGETEIYTIPKIWEKWIYLVREKYGENRDFPYSLLPRRFRVNENPWPALLPAVFHVSGRFWARENRRPKNLKNNFFQDKFYSSKAHAHYVTVFIYLTTWRAAELDIFTHFTFSKLPRCSLSMNSLIYVYSIQISSSFLWVLDHSREHTSSYYRRPKKFSVFPLHAIPSFIFSQFMKIDGNTHIFPIHGFWEIFPVKEIRIYVNKKKNQFYYLSAYFTKRTRTFRKSGLWTFRKSGP